ncbi:MAG: nucleotidyltransferase domain-containing protein [Deltaproteobacteria bacterium]|nr:nucleotidyltransferase domain-containing protein [Deltaproteobacteria bacterium]
MSLKQSEKNAIGELKKVLSEKYSLLDFRVFGSKARDEDTSESDIDIMIELSELNPSIEAGIDKTIFNINLQHDCFISAVLFSKKELEEGPLDQSPLYRVIEKEGVSL